MENKIRELEDFRDEFFEKNPGLLEDDLIFALEKRITQLIEEIPVKDENTKSYNLLLGTIYNVSPRYDPRAERYLSNAVKLDIHLSDGWIEMAVLMSKKKDPDFAIYCCEKSLENRATSKALYMLSCVLRMKAMQQSNLSNLEKNELFRRAMACGIESVALDPQCGKAHVYLGNSYFVHFVRSNSTFQVLDNAAECYRRALKCENEYRNPDLHLNYSEVLKYKQDYSGALHHLRLAKLYDPSPTPREKFENLTTYLNNIQLAIEKKGKIKPRKYQETLDILKKWEAKFTPAINVNTVKQRRCCVFDDLKNGENPQKIIIASVVSSISHEEQIPSTIVVIDSTGCAFSVMIYNVGASFGFIIGDIVQILDPVVIISENLKLSDSKTVPILKMIHVNNPTHLSRNGVRIQAAHVAPASFMLTDS